MKLNHKFALLLAGAVLAGSLTGCGASGTPASSAASSEAAASAAVSEAASEPAAEAALPDGVYTADFDTDSSMFHANEANDGKGTLTVKDGQMTFHVSLVSKKIVNLYVGMAADAEAHETDWLHSYTRKRFFTEFVISTYFFFLLGHTNVAFVNQQRINRRLESAFFASVQWNRHKESSKIIL